MHTICKLDFNIPSKVQGFVQTTLFIGTVYGFRYHLNCTCIFKSRFHEMTCARQQYTCLMAAEIAQYRLYCRSVMRHQIKSNPAAMIELALQPLH